MPLYMMEGFDHLGVVGDLVGNPGDGGTQGTHGWQNESAITSGNGSLITGRDGTGQAFRIASSSNEYLEYRLPITINDNEEFYMGFAYRYDWDPTSVNFPVFRGLTSGSSNDWALEIGPGGVLYYADRDSGGVNANQFSLDYLLDRDEWHYIQVRHVSRDDGQNGFGWIWINGRLLCGFHDRSRNSAAGFVNIRFHHRGGSSFTTDFDDIYMGAHNSQPSFVGVFDNVTGRRPTAATLPLDNPVVLAVFPDGDGATTNFTPDSGTTNYTQVDETSPDTTSWVESNTSAHIDLYDFAAVRSDVESVDAVFVNAIAIDVNNDGANNLGGISRDSGNNLNSDVDIDITNSYRQTQTQVWRDYTEPSNITGTGVDNPGAESPTDMTGWTLAGNSVTAWANENTGSPPGSASAGSRWYGADNDAGMTNNQVARMEHNITASEDSVPTADIDAGNLSLTLDCDIYGNASDDFRFEMRFRDADSRVIVHAFGAEQQPAASWNSATGLTQQVPEGTRSVDLVFTAIAEGAGAVQIYIDEITYSWDYLADDRQFTTTELDADEFGIRRI